MNIFLRNLLNDLISANFFNFNDFERECKLLNTQKIYDDSSLLFKIGKEMARMIVIEAVLRSDVQSKGKRIRLLGIPSAGSALVPAIMYDENWRHNFSFYPLRSQGKKSPPFQNRYIMGTPSSDEVPVLVDDFLVHGFSKISALKVCRNEGFDVTKVFTLFDFGYSVARARLANYGCEVHSIFSIADASFMEYCMENDALTKPDLEKLSNFLEDEEKRVREEEKRYDERVVFKRKKVIVLEP